MASIFEKFNKTIDLDGFRKDCEEAEKNGNNFEKVPFGDYEVKVDKLEMTISKSTETPMLTLVFKILDGVEKGRLIYRNQVLYGKNGKNLTWKTNRMLRDLCKDLEIENAIKFNDFVQYESLVMDVMEAIDGLEYVIKYFDNKGFDDHEITEVFEVE